MPVCDLRAHVNICKMMFDVCYDYVSILYSLIRGLGDSDFEVLIPPPLRFNTLQDEWFNHVSNCFTA